MPVDSPLFSQQIEVQLRNSEKQDSHQLLLKDGCPELGFKRWVS